MSKYILCEWEINGYDDSDFMLMYYDDVKKTLGTQMYATTRFGSCTCDTSSSGPLPEGASGYHLHSHKNYDTGEEFPAEVLLMPTAEAVEGARLILEETVFQALTSQDKRVRDEPEPSNLHKGMLLRLTVGVRNQITPTEPCRKCNGTGKWENPRNSEDRRECFACKGTGAHKVRGEDGRVAKVKDAKGKLVYDNIPADTVGEVMDWGSFGTFYRNGYNQPNRENTSVQLRTSEGKVFRATLAKCRMDRDYATPESLRKKATELSYNYHWPGASESKCAWLTRNFGAEVAQSAKDSETYGAAVEAVFNRSGADTIRFDKMVYDVCLEFIREDRLTLPDHARAAERYIRGCGKFVLQGGNVSRKVVA